MTFRVHHPIFARVYSRVSKSVESAGEADHRRRLLAELVGSVIEVGAGNGLNFPYYPSTVSEVIAVEPEPYLRERAKLAARHSTVRISIVEGDAEHLPLEYTSVDAAVVSLVLCSVADQHASLIEIRRVLRPGGELRF